MAKTIATLLGVLFILAGLVGFAWPTPMGAHFTPAHNVIHLVSGAVSLYLGLKGTLSAAKMFGFAFGAVYLLLGVAGFLAGTTVTEGGHTDTMLRLIPGTLEFGRTDHIIHIIFGGLYLVGAFMTSAGVSGPAAANAD